MRLTCTPLAQHESTADGIAAFEKSLRPHDPSQWMGSSTFNAGHVRPEESLLSRTKETKRFSTQLTDAERSGPLFQRSARSAS